MPEREVEERNNLALGNDEVCGRNVYAQMYMCPRLHWTVITLADSNGLIKLSSLSCRHTEHEAPRETTTALHVYLIYTLGGVYR